MGEVMGMPLRKAFLNVGCFDCFDCSERTGRGVYADCGVCAGFEGGPAPDSLAIRLDAVASAKAGGRFNEGVSGMGEHGGSRLL